MQNNLKSSLRNHRINSTWHCWEPVQNERMLLLQIPGTNVPTVSKTTFTTRLRPASQTGQKENRHKRRICFCCLLNLVKTRSTTTNRNSAFGMGSICISRSPKSSSRLTMSRQQHPAFEETAEGGLFSGS